MAGDLKKLRGLKKRALMGSDDLEIEIEVMEEDDIKAKWDLNTWADYILFKETKGIKEIYVCNEAQQDELQRLIMQKRKQQKD